MGMSKSLMRGIGASLLEVGNQVTLSRKERLEQQRQEALDRYRMGSLDNDTKRMKLMETNYTAARESDNRKEVNTAIEKIQDRVDTLVANSPDSRAMRLYYSQVEQAMKSWDEGMTTQERKDSLDMLKADYLAEKGQNTEANPDYVKEMKERMDQLDHILTVGEKRISKLPGWGGGNLVDHIVIDESGLVPPTPEEEAAAQAAEAADVATDSTLAARLRSAEREAGETLSAARAGITQGPASIAPLMPKEPEYSDPNARFAETEAIRAERFRSRKEDGLSNWWKGPGFFSVLDAEAAKEVRSGVNRIKGWFGPDEPETPEP